MANNEHLQMLQQGVATWGNWRQRNPAIRPDLSGANLMGANLGGADFWNVNLSGANLGRADLRKANLSEADLSRADLWKADLSGAILRKANLTETNLSRAILIDANFTEAVLTSCRIYGIAAWDVTLEGARQANLIITASDEPNIITVDNLKVAQFIYLLLNNQEIRDAITTLTTKVVLILGRFTPERKDILDALREILRRHNYLPVLVDFKRSRNRNLTETVTTLAHLARFIIADLTEPSSVPHELATIVQHNLFVPIVPLFHTTDHAGHEYAMFQDLRIGREWVAPIHHYTTIEDLLATLQTHVIEPAEKKAKELITLRNPPETEPM
jgi:Pentapeptide repeats (8 copies)